jgi:hypothetical protein
MWRREEPVLDRETLGGIIRMLMEVNAKLDLQGALARRGRAARAPPPVYPPSLSISAEPPNASATIHR